MSLSVITSIDLLSYQFNMDFDLLIFLSVIGYLISLLYFCIDVDYYLIILTVCRFQRFRSYLYLLPYNNQDDLAGIVNGSN